MKWAASTPRHYARLLRRCARAMPRPADRRSQSARGYIDLLRQHIFKEDNILFPMANRVIPAEQHEQVWQDFEHVEHEETGEGVHEKYLALAEALEKEVA